MSNHMLRGFGRAGALLAVCLFLAMAPSLMAQTSSSGALTGRITDSSGGAVLNATVTLTSLATAQSRTTMTREDGTYQFGLLPPGDYQLRIEATGFKTVDIRSVAVSVTETGVLDRALEVGAQSQRITVEGSVEQIQTTNATLGTVQNAETVTALPLNTRNYENLISGVAGANANVENASLLGKGSVFIAVNGAGFGQNTYQQDGVSVDSWYSFNTGTEGKSNASFAIPPPDAIAEFKIQTSGYDAGYGRNPGANVNVVTKTGTNNFHGDAYEFFRNTALNANTWFNNFFSEPRGVLNSNQYGGTFGGPIKKDKIFFFVSYQQTHQVNGLSGFGQTAPTLPPIPAGARGNCTAANGGNPNWTTCPDAVGQQFITNLASSLCPGNHPGATQSQYQTNDGGVGKGVQVLCPTTNAPQGNPEVFNINPVAINLLQAVIPTTAGPNGPYPFAGNYLIPGSGTSGFATQTIISPARFTDYNFLTSWDYVINSKQTFSVRYQYEKDPQYDGAQVQDANTPVGVYLPGEPGIEVHNNHSAILKLTTILSPRAVNQVNVAYERLVSNNYVDTPFTNSQFGISPLPPGPSGIPDNQLAFMTDGGWSVGVTGLYGANNPVNQIQANDQLSWERGKHSFRVGFGVEHVQARTFYPGHGSGTATFSTMADFLIGRADCQAAANPATCTTANPQGTDGLPANSNVAGGGTFNAAYAQYMRVNEINAFFQDDFKISPRLTLNMGLRWEYDGNITAKGGLEGSLWSSLINEVPIPGQTPQTGTLAGFVVPANYIGPRVPGLFVNNNNSMDGSPAPKTDFGPRLGFSWQPLSSNRWVLRGGGGVFYDVLPGNTILLITSVSPPASIPAAAGQQVATLAVPYQESPVIYPGPPGTAGFSTRWVDTTTPLSLAQNGVICPAPSVASPCSSNISLASNPQVLNVPVVYQWNLSSQYEFARNWVLEVAYVGTHGIHQLSQSRATLQGQGQTQAGFNIAQLAGTPQCTSTSSATNIAPGCPAFGVNTNTSGNYVLRVPYLGVSSTDAALLTNDNIKYNGASVTVRKQISYGLQLSGSYTHAAAFIGYPFGINTYPYIVQDYERNNNYHPDRFVITYVWNIPLPQYQGFKRQLLDGWTWSGVTTIQNGVPLTIAENGGGIFYGGNGSGSTAQLCPGMSYANLLSTGSLTSRVTSGLLNQTGGGYFNSAAICAEPTVGAMLNGVLLPPQLSSTSSAAVLPAGAVGGGTGFGNVGGGSVLGPGQVNFDMSLAKQFRVRESQTLLFRAEFFNTFNHAQFQIPALNSSASTGFGAITGLVASPRVIQLALKYEF